MNKPNYIFVKSYYKALRDIVINPGTVINYYPTYNQWEDSNIIYGAIEVNYLIKNGYIQEHKSNQLTLEHYLQVIGVDKTNVVYSFAKGVWEKLERNGYTITKNLVITDDPPLEKEIIDIPY
jgi:hypothetical protein